MKIEIVFPQQRALGALFCLTALVGLCAVGCGKKASEDAPSTPAEGASAPAAPGAAAAGGGHAPGNPNPNAAANAAAFEAARKKAEGK